MKRFAALAMVLLPSFAIAEADTLLREWRAGFTPLPSSKLSMHKLETTQEIFQAITGAEPSRWKGPRNSVEMVSWDEAAAFCVKATDLLRTAKLIEPDQIVRLPSEPEWELSCRAGTTTAFSFGDDEKLLPDFGWFDGNAAGNDPPTGAKKPNPWGLYDMHGYVWEWCANLGSENKPIRGGAWTSSAAECHSDSRKTLPRDTRRPDIGFRCVLATTGG
jgi:formylglycine-generating enzyme required for sulfatase activity